jgi:hypothetical protein
MTPTPTLADIQHASQQVALERDRRRYAVDAWAWVAECVWTVDELDPQSPVKPFPVAVCIGCARYLGHADRAACPGCGQPPAALTYLETLARQWQTANPPLLLVPKARRMKLTWLFCAVHAWLACVRPYVNAFLVSSKEQKSIELLDRVEGILVRCPRDRYRPPTWTRQQDLLTLENGSHVWAVAEGADQLRQFSATAILADEIGTWSWPRASYTAMVPCIEGGGRLTLLSSAYPGYWRELVAGEALG